MDDDDDIPISTRRFPLEKFQVSELVQEIKRREQTKRQMKFRPCDECQNFKAWTADIDPPDSYNPCVKGHAMSFRLPDDYPAETNWGFYRRPYPDHAKA